MNASFEEKSVWVQLITMALILGTYFLIALPMMSAGIMAITAYLPLFITCVVLMVAMQILGHLWIALSSRGECADERDHLIAWRAESRASWLVTCGVITSLAALAFALSPVWVAHILLLFLMLAELLKYALQLRDYRHGF